MIAENVHSSSLEAMKEMWLMLKNTVFYLCVIGHRKCLRKLYVNFQEL